LYIGIPEPVQNSEESKYTPCGVLVSVDAHRSASVGRHVLRVAEYRFLPESFKEAIRAQQFLLEWAKEFCVWDVYLQPS
jgi:hypothetical protein